MCHEYRFRWWKPEGTADKRAEDAKADDMATFTAPKDDKSKAVSQNKVDEKELVPAE